MQLGVLTLNLWDSENSGLLVSAIWTGPGGNILVFILAIASSHYIHVSSYYINEKKENFSNFNLIYIFNIARNSF